MAHLWYASEEVCVIRAFKWNNLSAQDRVRLTYGSGNIEIEKWVLFSCVPEMTGRFVEHGQDGEVKPPLNRNRQGVIVQTVWVLISLNFANLCLSAVA